VEQIRDESIDTYWQSDGNSQPHWISVHFLRRVAISHVCLYLDYNLDESYTPKRIQVQVGMTNQDLLLNTQVDLHEPVGWCIIPLQAPPDPLDTTEPTTETGNCNCLVKAHLLRISVLSMHQNGRDTHVRQVQLYGPRMMQANPVGNCYSSSGPNDQAQAPREWQFTAVR
jgi:anaphase-promoting complex subunit 10